jgi:hypothetical protein
MCWEKLTERDEAIDVRVTEVAREEDLERPDVWTATVAASEETERADELARV